MNILNILFLLNLINVIHSGRDFYRILQIDRKATTNQIKKAYRRLAKQMHPDANPDDPTANEKFQDLAAAYEVLSKPDMREKYDRFGEEGLKEMGGAGGFGGGDPFSSFFGDFFNFGGGGNRQADAPRGDDVSMTLEVTLEELYNGEFVEIVRNKPVAKPTEGTRKCNCRQEMITRQMGPNSFQMMQSTVCDECPNVRWETEERVLEVEIEQGMRDGDAQTFIAEGDPHVDGEPGDLRVVIRTLPHDIFERRDHDLYTNMTISLQQAMVGFSTRVKLLDGRYVKVSRDKITPHNLKLRKRGLGMPHRDDNNKHGDLLITFQVEFPNDLSFSDVEKKALQELLRQDNFQAKAFNGFRFDK